VKVIIRFFHCVNFIIKNKFLLTFTLESIGSIVCYDNFSNSRARIYGYAETYNQICNKAVVQYWGNFDSAGSGFGYNSNGDIFQYTALSQLLDD